MINKYLFAVLFIVLPYLVPAQQQRLGNMDDFIAKQVVDYQMPGLAIGIIHNHKVLFKKGYGTTSLPNGNPVDTQTVFPISSCTKAFTAMALAILVEENKLNWDDKVIQYLPDFKLSDPWITKELTIVDLLSHRSGLATFDGDLLWYGTSYTRKEIAEKIRHAPIRNDFRTEMGYQNVMYLVAGLVVEAISGKTWESFVNEKIFVPLSMRYLYASGRDTLIVIFNDPFVPPGAVIFERGTDKKVKSFKLNIDSQDFLFGDLDFRSVFSPL